MMKKKDAIGKNITVQNNYNFKRILIKYGISIAISVGLVFGILSLQGFWDETVLMEKYNILHNAFFFPGIMFILLGCLIALTNEGALTAIGWMLKRTFTMLNPFSKKKIVKYQDYMETRQKVSGYSFLFYTGLLFTSVSIVFLVLYYTV